MEGLIGYIARQHRLPRENLATEMLASILRGRRSFACKFLGHYGADLSPESYVQIELQRRGKEGRWIPDLQVSNEIGELCAVVESKFWAGFTRNQPESYLRDLNGRGLLLFVVPEKRRRRVFAELLARCRRDGREGNTKILIDGTKMSVISWESALDTLEDLALHNPADDKQLCHEVGVLRRFCEVADKEVFEPFQKVQLEESATGATIRQLIWITRNVVERCIDDRTLAPWGKKKLKTGIEGSWLNFGQEVRFCDVDAWVGLWFEMWEAKKLESPFLLALYNSRTAERIAKRLHGTSIAGSVIRLQTSPEGEAWLIPIPIKPGFHQNQVVDEAVSFLKELKGAFKSRALRAHA